MEGYNETKNYSMFRTCAWNRDISNKNLNKIDKSVQANGWKKHPIIVNENYEVIDGQHRLFYAKTHDLPVYYFVVPGLTPRDCVEMNNTRLAWSVEDYINFYVAQGNENYVRLRDLLRTYDFSTPTTIITIIKGYMSSGGVTTATLRAGEFELTEDETTRLTKKLDFFQDLKPYINKIKGRCASLWTALSFCYDCEAVNNKRLKNQVITRTGMIVPPVDMEQAMKEIEKIYNYKISNDNYVGISDLYKKYVRAKLNKQIQHVHDINMARTGNRAGRYDQRKETSYDTDFDFEG